MVQADLVQDPAAADTHTTMPVLVQVDFPFTGPFGDAMTEGMRELAESIAKVSCSSRGHGPRVGDPEVGEG